MEKTFFKKFLPLMIFMLFLIGLLGNVGEAQLSDEPPEAATTDLEWALIVDGAVNQPINLTFNDLSTMPRSMVNSVLYRMGSLVTLGDWVGVKLDTFSKLLDSKVRQIA
jgi:DMSO/TMAO reductase YedYZ molybdopterin-dependent catalytic subunit